MKIYLKNYVFLFYINILKQLEKILKKFKTKKKIKNLLKHGLKCQKIRLEAKYETPLEIKDSKILSLE